MDDSQKDEAQSYRLQNYDPRRFDVQVVADEYDL